jgi:serine/threonine protein kinase/Tfp pilus assembly protein PilF
MKCPKCNFENPADTKFCGECAAPLHPAEEISVSPTKTLETPTDELSRGTTFAERYEIIEELGKGGMGKVYRVFDKKIEEEVALKLLTPEIAADKKTIERFRNELKLARKVGHRNVCKMYDLNEMEGTHYITMEYVPGEDLKSFIRRAGLLNTGKTIFIGKQVCEGLAEAHRLGVVHRDLKPSNIMIDREGNARIMDFGIARSLEAKGITGAGVMIGTPEYMSPEQVEAKETDQRSDIYSLGVILYEMVTGRVPFEGETPLSIAMKHKSEEPPDPKELNAQIPEDLSRVILRCMEKDKENRYQSTGEVHSELDKIEKGIPTTERVVPKRKPITSREITVTFGLKKLFIPAIVVVALIIAAIAIWQLLPKKEAIRVVPSGKPSLAIMYFKNNTGDENLDHWRTALADLLITDLAQSKYIRVLSEDKLFNILGELNQLEAKSYSSKTLEEVASRGRVSHILQGNYTKAGDIFRMNITLQETAAGELIGSERVEGIGEKSFYTMVDALTRRIKASFELSQEQIASDMDKEIEKITTSSPEAYKYYSEGRKYHFKPDNRKSIEFMEKAVTIDPEFAMAYRSMAISYKNLGYRSEAKKILKKALELTDRLSDRERYVIQGDFYRLSEKTYNKAIEAFNKLLQLYPEDVTGNVNLGVLYRDIEEWDKAMERFEVIIEDKVEALFAYTSMANAYSAKGLYDKAREVLEYYLNNFSDNIVIRRSLATTYIHQGKFDLALAEVDKEFYLDPTFYRIFRQKGDIYQYKGDLIESEKAYQKLLEIKELRANYQGWERLATLCLSQGKFEKAKEHIKQTISWAEKMGEIRLKIWSHGYLGWLHLESGNHDHALKEIEKAWNTAVASDITYYQRRVFYWRGLTYVKMKSLDKSQRAADEYKKRIDKGMNKKEIRFYYDLMGKIELERENFSKAIEYIKKALSLDFYGPLTRPAHFLESLALAYYKAGDLEKAKAEYERITSLTTGRLYYGDIYAKSFYMLGKVCEQKGWKGKAIEHYEKFLDLWKEADPGIAEVEDAKKRLAGLQIQ